MTPSYALNFLRSEPASIPDNEAEREKVFDAILDGNLEWDRVSYVHCRLIKLGDCPKCGFEPAEGVEQEVLEEACVEWCNEASEWVELPGAEGKVT